jgi:heterotetrameric sarcosine oxidase gamma subunit
VPELIAKSALDGQGPLIVLGTTLVPVDLGPITSVALFPKKATAVNKVLKPLGLSFPAPGTTTAGPSARLVWTGPDQAFLIGMVAPDFGAVAATTDQSDGWSALHLSGALMPQVMSRLCPLDFRLAVFKPGQAARAQLGHMNAIFWAIDDGLMILTFRSMAKTAWDELAHALHALAARVKAGV